MVGRNTMLSQRCRFCVFLEKGALVGHVWRVVGKILEYVRPTCCQYGPFSPCFKARNAVLFFYLKQHVAGICIG